MPLNKLHIKFLSVALLAILSGYSSVAYNELPQQFVLEYVVSENVPVVAASYLIFSSSITETSVSNYNVFDFLGLLVAFNSNDGIAFMSNKRLSSLLKTNCNRISFQTEIFSTSVEFHTSFI